MAALLRLASAAALALACSSAAPAAPAADAQLFAFAIRGANQTGEEASTALIDAVTGRVDFKKTSFNHGSDAFCDVAFRRTPVPAYLVPAAIAGGKTGETQILTIHAASGIVSHASPKLSKTYEYPASAFDEESGLIYAIGIPPEGGSDIITVDPDSGKVEVVAAQIGLPDIQLCEAAFLREQFFFAWMDDTSQIVVTYDVASKNVSQVHYIMCPGECRGGMNTLVPFVDEASNSTHLLAMAVYGGPGAPSPAVIEIDPAVDDSIKVLARCPEDTISSPQGAGTFDAASKTFYTVMLYTNNTQPMSVYYQLVSTNLDTPAYNILRLDEGGSSDFPASQLWSIDVA